MKKFVSFIALVAISLSLFAQEDCVSVATPTKGSVTITFKRYKHKEMPGFFTINASGDRVRFAQGNLQYRASTNTWRFAEEQYDVMGAANANISNTYDGWIDLFGFATSGWNGTSATEYQPWSVSNTAEDYYSGSAIGDYANADWAYYNAIVNGGDELGPATHLWFTLTQDEWNYVLARGTGTLSGMGSIDVVKGLFLLPDDWATIAAGLTGDLKNFADNFVGIATAKSFENNSVSYSVWSDLEDLGVVFLPVSGTRSGKTVSNQASHAYYWTTSRYNNANAYMLYVYEGYCQTYRASRAAGRAVRPVQRLRTN